MKSVAKFLRLETSFSWFHVLIDVQIQEEQTSQKAADWAVKCFLLLIWMIIVLGGVLQLASAQQLVLVISNVGPSLDASNESPEQEEDKQGQFSTTSRSFLRAYCLADLITSKNIFLYMCFRSSDMKTDGKYFNVGLGFFSIDCFIPFRLAEQEITFHSSNLVDFKYLPNSVAFHNLSSSN